MSIQHVTDLGQFRELLANSGQKLVVVDFHATWCGPCHAVAPAVEALARAFASRTVFLKVDVDAAAEVAQSCAISAMPTFHGYKRNNLVFSFSGADAQRLASEIEQHAPPAAELAFSGRGQALGTDASPNIAGDSSPLDNVVPDARNDSSSARAAAAAAAARRAAAAADGQGDCLEIESTTSSLTAAPVGAATPTPSVISDVKPALPDAAQVPAPSDVFADKGLLQALLEMGFPEVRAVKALIATKNRSAEVAMDWCFEHSEDPDIDVPLSTARSISEPSLHSNEDTLPVSTNDATSHAGLSAEERKARAEDLIAKARATRLAEEKAAELERERNRIATGKEVAKAKLAHEEQQRRLMVEKKRQEKAEILAERQRIRERIAADKEARRMKFHMAPPAGHEEQRVDSLAPDSAQPMAPVKPSGGTIQFRLADGTRLESTFESGDTIGHAMSFIASQRPDLFPGKIKLLQQYPKREFTDADKSLFLVDLKLLPRGALHVSLG